jgi:DNA-binding NarL/FixJ family response regulator
MEGRVIRVVVVDDHPAVRAGIAAWYQAADAQISVVASSQDPGVAWVEPGRSAEVVVLDLHLDSRREPVFSELRRLADDGRQVVVYSMRDDGETAIKTIDLGAFTYLTKNEGEDHLVAATIAAARNLPYTPPALAGAMGTDRRLTRPVLTPREETVLLEWFQCESKTMVAEKLGISERTVAGYLDRVRIRYASAGRPAPTKAALVARAIQDGLVSPDDL